VKFKANKVKKDPNPKISVTMPEMALDGGRDKYPLRDRSNLRSSQSLEDVSNVLNSPKRKKERKETTANIPTSNSFGLLDNLDDIDMEENNNNNQSEKPQNSRNFRPLLKQFIRVKPIIVFKTTNEALQRLLKDLGVKCCFAKLGKDSYKIQPNNAEEKKLISGKLLTAKLECHTYTETSDRKAMYVLKGLDLMETEEVETILKEEKIAINKVTMLSKNENYPLYLVSFEKGPITLKYLRDNHQIVNYTRVVWDKLNERERRPTQCKRCQAWGHAASNCTRQYRCMKCTEAHGPGECRRTKENKDNSPPACVNCGKKGHLSSSYECESFIRYKVKIERRRPTREAPRQFISTIAPWAQQQQRSSFPALETSSQPLFTSNNVNRQKVSQKFDHTSPFEEIEALKAELNSIPGIDQAILILKKLITDLKTCKNPTEQASKLFNFMTSKNGF
jgi:hypothetical protein